MYNNDKYNIMNDMFRYVLLIAGALSFGLPSTWAQDIPISVQGVVRNSDGSVFPNGNYTLKFRIYKSLTGGSAIWTEEQKDIPIAGGVYSALLGNVTPLNIAFNQDLYLGVSVDGGTELNPRARFTAASAARYAFRSPTGAPVGLITVFGGPKVQIPDGWLYCDGRALKSADFPSLFAVIGTTYGNGSSGLGSGGGTDFNLPDLRSEFIRGVDAGRGVDSSRTVGSIQDWSTAVPSAGSQYIFSLVFDGFHFHILDKIVNRNTGEPIGAEDSSGYVSGASYWNDFQTGGLGSLGVNLSGSHSHKVTITGGGDAETRPVNTAVHFFIKF